MKNKALLFAALLIGCVTARAQVSLGGHLYVPSTTDSLQGQTNVVFTADADCTLATQTNCTVTDTGGFATDGPYLGTLKVTSSVTLTATRKVIVILSPGRGYVSFNETTGSQHITVIAATGTGVDVPNGSTPVVAQSDGTNYGNPGGTIGGITALTGDGSASGPGSAALTLATVNTNVGACGDATHVSQITLNAKGLATGCTPVTITGAAPTGSAGGVLSGTYPNPGFAAIAANSVLANATGSSAAPTAVTTLPTGLTIPSPVLTGTITGSPTASGAWTMSGGLSVVESGFGTTGFSVTSSSYPFLTLLNTSASAAARNWVLASSYAGVGDFAIAQSNAKGGDPTASGTVRVLVALSGDVGINTTTDCGQVLCVNGTVAATSYTGTWAGTALTSSQIPSNVAYTGVANNFGFCCTQTFANLTLEGVASGNGFLNLGLFSGIAYHDIYGASSGVYGAQHIRLFTPGGAAEIDPEIIQFNGIYEYVPLTSAGITDSGGLHETGAMQVNGLASFGSTGQTTIDASGNIIVDGTTDFTGVNTFDGSTNFNNDVGFGSSVHFMDTALFGADATFHGDNTYTGDNSYTGSDTFTGTVNVSGTANFTGNTNFGGATGINSAGFLTIQGIQDEGHLGFTQTSPPTVSTCGGGSISGTDNSWKVTGITTATACTVTFHVAILQGVCTVSSSNSTIAPEVTTVSTSAVTIGMSSLTGSLYGHCF